MLLNKSRTIKITSKLHNRTILVTDHNTLRKSMASKHLNPKIKDKGADPEESLRETPRPPTHSQAEWE